MINLVKQCWHWFKTKLDAALARCGAAWACTRAWYQLLSPARASLFASALVPLLFIFIPQGLDTVRQTVSPAPNHGGEWWYFSRQAWFMLFGLAVAGLASWAWTRFLLNCRFGPPPADGPDEATLEKWKRRVRCTCGSLPSFGMAVAFLRLGHVPGNEGRRWWLVGLAAAIALGLYFFFEVARRVHHRVWHHAELATEKPRAYAAWSEVEFLTRGVICVAVIISILIGAALTRWPVELGQTFGSPAVLLLAVATWINLGSLVIYWGHRYRVPIFTLLIGWLLACSYFNDSHDIRTLPKQPGAPRAADITDALNDWYDATTALYPNAHGTNRPLYLVAAAGGGVRAAYWTGIVLGELEDRAREQGTSFAAHTFALSGVSGGALGEVTFAALRAHVVTNNYRATAGRLLDDDFLAALVAKLAFADLLQLVLPFPVRRFDRARALEDAWAAAWRKELKMNVLEETLADLYAQTNADQIRPPHLLLNGTCVETGQRIITRDLEIEPRVWRNGHLVDDGDFLDTLSAARELSNAPIRLSTAAHQSARFTYFSPAGRFPDGTHVVDGGYFENSGATTLMNLLTVIEQHMALTNNVAKWSNVKPVIVLIDNDPIRNPSPKVRPVRFMSETLSPVLALLHTRDARGSYASQEALDYGPRVFEFHLYERPPSTDDQGQARVPVELPLGWSLSGAAIKEMEYQLSTSFYWPSFATNSLTGEVTTLMNAATNPLTVSNLITTLPGK
ncbi:MAG: hypothetical protein HY301_20000 [Verrucomicrobia bacterium]|nr:hypothetical protein [Verrucomicrobiota bacterium]